MVAPVTLIQHKAMWLQWHFLDFQNGLSYSKQCLNTVTRYGTIWLQGQFLTVPEGITVSEFVCTCIYCTWAHFFFLEICLSGYIPGWLSMLTSISRNGVYLVSSLYLTNSGLLMCKSNASYLFWIYPTRAVNANLYIEERGLSGFHIIYD